MFNFSISSNTIIFMVKEKETKRKYRIIAKSCKETNKDIAFNDMNLHDLTKFMKIKTLKVSPNIALTIEDYLIDNQSKEYNCGVLIFEGGKDKCFIIKTADGDKKYFSMKRMYDEILESLKNGIN